MKALAIRHFGGPEVLEVLELPEPHPADDQVRIRVHAAAVNPTDVALRSGDYGQALANVQPPYIPGMDAAGVVDALGPRTDGRLKVGDKVVAIVLPTSPTKGAYAEQIVVPTASVVPMPAPAD